MTRERESDAVCRHIEQLERRRSFECTCTVDECVQQRRCTLCAQIALLRGRLIGMERIANAPPHAAAAAVHE